MEDFVARRTKTAESKIALAEAQALADVRAAAANAAVDGGFHHPVANRSRAGSPTICWPRASRKFAPS